MSRINPFAFHRTDKAFNNDIIQTIALERKVLVCFQNPCDSEKKRDYRMAKSHKSIDLCEINHTFLENLV